MHTSISGVRTLTELDHVRLAALLRRSPPPAARGTALVDLLDTADLVPSRQVDPDVVTMYSQVLLADAADGSRRKLTPCYPGDAEPDAGFVSVLSPIGAALLGSRVGDVIHWRTPSGAESSAAVVALLFQPEASGDYTL